VPWPCNALRGTLPGDGQLLQAGKFFPIFLLIGYLKWAVGRWGNFVELGYSIQGRIHDIGLLVSDMADPPWGT
jgi:hypothetical protein